MNTTECKRCLLTSDIATLTDTQCEYCDMHDALIKQSNPKKLEPLLEKIRKRKGKYNCLIGISGGLDSSTMLYLAVTLWKLRPLVIHFDNNWNTQVAKDNMDNLIQRLGVDAIFYRVNKTEYDWLNRAFLAAGTPDADIPNDIAMTKLMYETANMYGIKYILNGHDFREEGSTPREWTYMDAQYIRSVFEWYAHRKLQNYPLFTFRDQLYYAFKGIKQIRPFYYIQSRKHFENQMIQLMGWESYGPKHAENIYTAFVGAYYLPKKFNIDKRRVYLSAQIRTGTINKAFAKGLLATAIQFNLSSVRMNAQQIESIRLRDRSFFRKYDFKTWRPLMWILMKLKVVPYTFYVKYCT